MGVGTCIRGRRGRGVKRRGAGDETKRMHDMWRDGNLTSCVPILERSNQDDGCEGNGGERKWRWKERTMTKW